MTFTHSTTLTWRGTNGAAISGVESDSADAEMNTDVTVASSTEQRVDLSVVAARVKHVYLLSDQTVTLRTNDAATGTPIDTIALTANYPFNYSAAGGSSGPFTVDVTSFWITNATAAAATVKIRVLQDATP